MALSGIVWSLRRRRFIRIESAPPRLSLRGLAGLLDRLRGRHHRQSPRARTLLGP